MEFTVAVNGLFVLMLKTILHPVNINTLQALTLPDTVKSASTSKPAITLHDLHAAQQQSNKVCSN